MLRCFKIIRKHLWWSSSLNFASGNWTKNQRFFPVKLAKFFRTASFYVSSCPTGFPCLTCIRALSAYVPSCLCLLCVSLFRCALCAFIFLRALRSIIFLCLTCIHFFRCLTCLLFYMPYVPSFFYVPYVPLFFYVPSLFRAIFLRTLRPLIFCMPYVPS